MERLPNDSAISVASDLPGQPHKSNTRIRDESTSTPASQPSLQLADGGDRPNQKYPPQASTAGSFMSISSSGSVDPYSSSRTSCQENITPSATHYSTPLSPPPPSRSYTSPPASDTISSSQSLSAVPDRSTQKLPQQPTITNTDERHEDCEDEDEDDEQEVLAATEQAEDGSIIVDQDDVGTDAGYETDTNASASTSLAESVRDYVFENGRRYHRFREGRYNFPNDDVEQQREDMKHNMVKMLCGQLYFAPIGDNPRHIIDLGTGTGIWAIEMGDLFERADILGVDLSPHQPEWVPPNVRFMVDDVESPWLHPENYFDYIHSRHTVMAIKDWPKLLRTGLDHLRPGGWFEMQEVVHFPVSMNGTMPPDHPVAQYWSLITEGLRNLGIDFHAAAGGRLAAKMREAGYVNVTERVLQIPIGTWPKNKVLKTVGLYWRIILMDGIQAIALGPLTRGLKWSREQVELFLIQVRRAYHDNSCLMYMPLHIVYGQKPERGY